MPVKATISAVTEAIIARSTAPRRRYLDKIDAAVARQPKRKALGCANIAHGFAACGAADKNALRNGTGPNLGIVTAYNDMLSAHQPFETYPELIRKAARAAGGTAQVAGGVPAMCDGVTQGETGHGAVAVLARRDRAVDGRGTVAPDVRCGRLSRRLRQDRARPHHRRLVLRAPARRVHSGRPDDQRPAERREGQDPPALCRGQGDARRAAGSRGPVLSRPRHLHLLRHCQFQPDADGDHGPPSAGLDLRQSRHAAARCHHPRLGEAGPVDHGTWQRLPADRPHL